MKISVVVCTYNRCEDLRMALQSLILQDFPASDYEILVVDNNSMDRTKDIVHDFVNKSNDVQVRYVFEEKIGLSHARNRGIAEAKGNIIAFIDDDARAEKSWLLKLAQVYDEEGDAGCVGGRVLLDWPVEKPSWWHPDLDEVFNGINYSDERIALIHPRYPYGTNISFRADVLRKVGSFKTDLGRIGSKLLAGEETELCLRIEREGYKVFYEPSSIVYHRVETAKLNKSYIRKRAFWHGRSYAIIEFRHMKKEQVSSKAKEFISYLRRWVRKRKYPIHEQHLYLFFAGYVYQYCKSHLWKA